MEVIHYQSNVTISMLFQWPEGPRTVTGIQQWSHLSNESADDRLQPFVTSTSRVWHIQCGSQWKSASTTGVCKLSYRWVEFLCLHGDYEPCQQRQQNNTASTQFTCHQCHHSCSASWLRLLPRPFSSAPAGPTWTEWLLLSTWQTSSQMSSTRSDLGQFDHIISLHHSRLGNILNKCLAPYF